MSDVGDPPPEPPIASSVPPRRVVILGAGITGLSAAYRLLKTSREAGDRAPRLSVTVLEASDRLGGNIRTERVDGFILDGGPDAFVASKPHATALCKELGLGDRLIGTIERNRKVYVLHDGHLEPLPEGMFLAVPTQLIATARTGLLSWQGKARAARELTLPPKLDKEDESIASFVRRRLGDEVAERIADPLLGGIFSGDTEALSIKATFPQLVDLEVKYGSLIRGVLAQKAARAKQAASASEGGPLAFLKRRAQKPPSAFHSLVGGVGELVDALSARIEELGGEIRTRTAAELIVRPDDPRASAGARFLVKTALPSGAHAPLLADDVVLALPAYSSADVLRELDAELSALLRSIPYESTATVVLAYRRSAVPHALDASGLIIPKGEGRRVNAVTFITSKWEGRAPPGTALLRVFVGGHRGGDVVAQDDGSLIEIATSELASILGIRGEPTLTRIYRHPRASAQPLVGHLEKAARAHAREALYPGLHIAGGALDGIGIPDCVRIGSEIARKIVAPPRAPSR